jgi:hypothetical protein
VINLQSIKLVKVPSLTPTMLIHGHNPSTQKVQEEFEYSLGNVGIPCLKETKNIFLLTPPSDLLKI